MSVGHTFRSFYLDETGQDLIEYALIAGLMGLGAVITLKSLANSVVNVFNAVGTTLSTAA